MNSLRLAVGTLTAFWVRSPARVDRRVAGGAMLLAPVAVLPLFAIAGCGLWLSTAVLGLPALVGALLSVAVLALGTRCLHWDGLSDVADGLTASYDAARSLEVMKSGTSGPAGTVAVILVLALQTVALASFAGFWQGAVVAAGAGCLSRMALLVCCAAPVPGARKDGLGSAFVGSVPTGVAAVALLLGAALLAGLGHWIGVDWWRGALAFAVAMAVVLALVARARARFGGVTGDVFGASIEVAAAAIWIGLS